MAGCGRHYMDWNHVIHTYLLKASECHRPICWICVLLYPIAGVCDAASMRKIWDFIGTEEWDAWERERATYEKQSFVASVATNYTTRSDGTFAWMASIARSQYVTLACAQCASRTEAPSNGLRKYHRRERDDPQSRGLLKFNNRPVACAQCASCTEAHCSASLRAWRFSAAHCSASLRAVRFAHWSAIQRTKEVPQARTARPTVTWTS